ncbi:hypothetical protein [Micromonospora craniellae]|uniref:DUF2637 domain-containing protein n=1 Tax=Micromonospora craniellae TaxID=2294034 RepID=A0A372G5T5_9ACTN|nr:hypothetical protein [Micromonospora craniellae]QOC90240.1 hypothetical protein ID554_18820 [Micromonospora craniellae]RFS48372.1 hypothetical protein D0Q02_02530 [Micromonospora craniellae]
MATTNPPASWAARMEGVVLVLIVIFVGLAAGAASFTHVHDWTMANSPDGTPGWFGWANAVISELVPVACLLIIRRRKRHGGPIGYPLVLLVAFAGFSLAAQLGVAVGKVGPTGWFLSAVPALAFMALVKLVLAPVHDDNPAPAPTPVEPIRVPAAEHVTATPEPVPPAAITAPDPTPAVEPTPAPAVEPEPVTVPAVEPVDIPTHLLPMARFSAVQHEQTTGRAITAAELADRLDITPATAGHLLTTLTGGAR